VGLCTKSLMGPLYCWSGEEEMGEEDSWSKERLQEEIKEAREKESLFLFVLMLQLTVGIPLIYISSRITSNLDRIGIWIGFIFEILMFLPILASMYGYEYYRKRYERYKSKL
jgi:hypothetical protein